MSYKNDERLITVLKLISNANLGSDQTGLFAKYDDLVDEMDSDAAAVDEIIGVLLTKKYIRSANEKYKSVHKYDLEYQAYQITALGSNYLASFGTSPSITLNNIDRSNIAIDSQYVSQVINDQDDETRELLGNLVESTQLKDKSAILKTLGYIGDKSLDLLIAIVAGGVKR